MLKHSNIEQRGHKAVYVDPPLLLQLFRAFSKHKFSSITPGSPQTSTNIVWHIIGLETCYVFWKTVLLNSYLNFQINLHLLNLWYYLSSNFRFPNFVTLFASFVTKTLRFTEISSALVRLMSVLNDKTFLIWDSFMQLFLEIWF